MQKLFWLVLAAAHLHAADPNRSMRFHASDRAEAEAWQKMAREKLLELMMGGAEPARVPLEAKILRRIASPLNGFVLEETTIQALPDRRVHLWVARPAVSHGKIGAVLALHGHGGSGEEVVRGLSLYGYGKTLIEMGYVVIAPDIGSHERQHSNWSLMGERVWDALRSLDYAATLPEVDPERLAVAGLSLGGETAMYVAALDIRVKTACSSGWLTTIENMRNGHCPCWNFEGLAEHFDFSDVFACIAPRPLVCEIGAKERAPGGFPVAIAREAFTQIESAYRVFHAESNAVLTVHQAGHVFNGRDFWPRLQSELGQAWPWNSESSDQTAELLRRGEIARRNFCRAVGVFDGWWRTRDPETGLYPRRLDQPVWAPNDNAADMLPFLALTAFYTTADRLPEVLAIIPKERALTDRVGPLPDWFGLTNHAFVYPSADMRRLIFCAAEYAKDGCLPMTEAMGRGPWVDRMIEMTDAVFEHAPVSSDFGKLPVDDTEVNGEILQVLSRLYFLTDDPKYLRWAERIGDAYCFEVLPANQFIPAQRWDFTQHRPIQDEFSLNDHGNEIVGGLSELFVATANGDRPKFERYREPLLKMAQRLLEKARHDDGLWFERVRASTGEPIDRGVPDTWGYALAGLVTLSDQMGASFGSNAVEKALLPLPQPQYLDWNGADSYADSIEGALVLLNRFAEPAGFQWLENILPIFLGKQRDDGIVEGWYGDGNYARTALMAALYYTQGVRCRPWNAALRLGAAREGDRLILQLQSDAAWNGNIMFDQPRHRLFLHLPTNYPRLNEFPEWFTVQPAARYTVKSSRGEIRELTGPELIAGVGFQLDPGESVRIQIVKK